MLNTQLHGELGLDEGYKEENIVAMAICTTIIFYIGGNLGEQIHKNNFNFIGVSLQLLYPGTFMCVIQDKASK